MSPKRILVNAKDREETRVAVVRDGKIVDFEGDGIVKGKTQKVGLIAKIREVKKMVKENGRRQKW